MNIIQLIVLFVLLVVIVIASQIYNNSQTEPFWPYYNGSEPIYCNDCATQSSNDPTYCGTCANCSFIRDAGGQGRCVQKPGYAPFLGYNSNDFVNFGKYPLLSQIWNNKQIWKSPWNQAKSLFI